MSWFHQEDDEAPAPLPDAKYVIWALYALVPVLLGPAIYYWWLLRDHFSWSRCVLGDAPCSLAVSTYLLCLVTLFAFIAAYTAAVYAARALRNEQRAALAIQRCRRKHRNKRGAVELYLDESIGRLFTEDPPAGFERRTWFSTCFLASGVGRSPVVNAQLDFAAAFSGDRQMIDGTAYLGTLEAIGRAHIVIWAPRRNLKIVWSPRATHNEGKALRLYIQAREAAEPTVVLPLTFGMGEQAPAQFEGPATRPEPPRSIWQRIGTTLGQALTSVKKKMSAWRIR